MEARALAAKGKNGVATRRVLAPAKTPRSAQAFDFCSQATADSPEAFFAGGMRPKNKQVKKIHPIAG
jgi:hypothetical protein